MTRHGGVRTGWILAVVWGLAATRPVGTAPAQRDTAVLSGAVSADHGDVVAFRVKANDTVHKIGYTIFTQRGRYAFHALPPGHYEVAVLEDGYESAPQPVDLAAGGSATADLTAKWTNPASPREAVEFDQLYPPGPARDTIIRACFGCHGVVTTGKDGGFHGHVPKDERGWRNAVSRMFTPGAIDYGNWGGTKHVAYISEDTVSAAEREAIVKYFAANFGPGSKPRKLKVDPIVRDEAALGEAMYIQYALPPNHGIHDVYPSRAMPGWVWTSMTPGFIVGTDTRNPNFPARTKDYPIPDPNGAIRSHGIIEDRGHVYWTEINGNHIGELDPKTGVMNRYPAATAGGWTHTLRADSKGNIWASYMSSANKLLRLDAVTKQVTDVSAIKAANSYGLIVDRKDRVWLSVVSNKGVPMYDSRSGRWAMYETTNSTRRPSVDSKGHVWAAQYFGDAITEIDPDTGRVTDYKLPLKYGDPYDVVPDPKDTLWIETAMYDSLVRFDQKTKAFTYVPFPVLNGHSPKLESDDEGTIWCGLGSQLTSLKMHGNVPVKK